MLTRSESYEVTLYRWSAGCPPSPAWNPKEWFATIPTTLSKGLILWQSSNIVDEEGKYRYGWSQPQPIKVTDMNEEFKTYRLYDGKIVGIEKPIDMFDDDWERFKDANSSTITFKHNSIFDSPVTAGPPLETFKWIDFGVKEKEK